MTMLKLGYEIKFDRAIERLKERYVKQETAEDTRPDEDASGNEVIRS
jgi:hypothetical protein